MANENEGSQITPGEHGDFGGIERILRVKKGMHANEYEGHVVRMTFPVFVADGSFWQTKIGSTTNKVRGVGYC